MSDTYLNCTSLPCIYGGLALKTKEVCGSLRKLGAEDLRVSVGEL